MGSHTTSEGFTNSASRSAAKTRISVNVASVSIMAAGGAATTTPDRIVNRLAVASFFSLFGILCAQSLLETARDTLFLTHLSLTGLPWLYLGMAALTLLVTALPSTRAKPASSARVSTTLILGAAVTATLAAALAVSDSVAVYLLFIWTGIFSAFVVTQIWTVLAESADMSFAKRLYGRVAAGGGLGAVAGAALARAVGHRLEPRHLVLVAAVIAAVTALAPALALRRGDRPHARDSLALLRAARARVRTSAGQVGNPYVKRLVLLALLAAAVSTLLDFSLKQALASQMAVDRLPRFFANFHLATSTVSLLVQLFGVGLLVRFAGVGRVQAIFPLALLAGVLVTVLSGGLAAVVMLRGFDAALRTSFQRPTFELLQVPLPDGLRRRAKPLIDSVGQRGGQALGGLALVVVMHFAPGPQLRMALVAVLLGVWFVVALRLGRRYVDLLRSTLLQPNLALSSDGRLSLDLTARDTLTAALGSAREPEVLAAIDLLVVYGKASSIPLTLLHHVSPAVVRRAVETVAVDATDDRAPGFLAALDELSVHPSVMVRQAALRRRAALAPDRARLTQLAEDDTACAVVRGVALVVLLDNDWDAGGRFLAQLVALVGRETAAVRLAVAEALAERPSSRFDPVLRQLAATDEPPVLAAVAATLGQIGGLSAAAILISLLEKRQARVAARAALARLGAPAFALLAARFADASAPQMVRANAPRALAEIDPERSARVLVEALLVEEDGHVRYRTLRALNRVRRQRPHAEMDPDILGREAMAAAASSYRYLGWRILLEEGATRRPDRRTEIWGLLKELLQEKEENAVERLFRVLSLRYPHDDFRRLLRAVRIGGRRTRAAGRELVDNLLSGPAQAWALALIADDSDRERLSALEKVAAVGASTAAVPDDAEEAGVGMGVVAGVGAGSGAGAGLGADVRSGVGAEAEARARYVPTYRELLAHIVDEEKGGTLAALAAHHLEELTAAAMPLGPPVLSKSGELAHA